MHCFFFGGGRLYDGQCFTFHNLKLDSFHPVKECTKCDAVQEGARENEVQFCM